MGIHKQFRKASSCALVSLIMGGFVVFQNSVAEDIDVVWVKQGGNSGSTTITVTMPDFTPVDTVGIALDGIEWEKVPGAPLFMFGNVAYDTLHYLVPGTTEYNGNPGDPLDLLNSGVFTWDGTETGLVCFDDWLSLVGPGKTLTGTVSNSALPPGYVPPDNFLVCENENPAYSVYIRIGDSTGFGLPGMTLFSGPNLPLVGSASKKGDKNSVSLGNSGFAPVGNGMMIGVGYDRADNSVSNTSDANFDGNEYRIHLDLLKGHNNLIYGIAAGYRAGKYMLNDNITKYKTKYYGPRVDLGYRGMDSWAQLSGGYYFGNAYVDDDKGSNGYLAQLGLLAQMDKWLSNRFSLKPGVDVQYIWQKLGTLSGTVYENRNYGRADLNLGLGIAFNRGWALTPNLGYRWDIRSACTQVQGAATKICEPKANGLRYGVQLAKAVLVTGSKWDELAVSAYYDYFKKSGVKQSVWGVMAQYPF